MICGRFFFRFLKFIEKISCLDRNSSRTCSLLNFEFKFRHLLWKKKKQKKIQAKSQWNLPHCLNFEWAEKKRKFLFPEVSFVSLRRLKNCQWINVAGIASSSAWEDTHNAEKNKKQANQKKSQPLTGSNYVNWMIKFSENMKSTWNDVKYHFVCLFICVSKRWVLLL